MKRTWRIVFDSVGVIFWVAVLISIFREGGIKSLPHIAVFLALGTLWLFWELYLILKKQT
jgi:hypothetical protein